MDRRAKKLEQKRKQRATVKKQSNALKLRNQALERMAVKTAAQAPFGPCWVSGGWDDMASPRLVHVVVTRRLATGRLLPAVALVDRTCLGVKDGHSADVMSTAELGDYIDKLAEFHGEMIECEPIVAQSVVFHAIDYADKLGFQPHPDFPAALFGARPEALHDTPWHAAEKPYYIAGPYDDAAEIVDQLRAAVGDGNFGFVADGVADDDEDHDEDDDEIIDTTGETVVTQAVDTVP
ncbi:MAG: hypothetical protein RL701_7293 [Pseudomonadota bacterium]